MHKPHHIWQAGKERDERQAEPKRNVAVQLLAEAEEAVRDKGHLRVDDDEAEPDEHAVADRGAVPDGEVARHQRALEVNRQHAACIHGRSEHVQAVSVAIR